MRTKAPRHVPSLYNNMLVLVFLLLGRTGCDWVEITQNRYRKEPLRQVTVNINFQETTEGMYRNNSFVDKHWKKGVIDRVPNVVNFRRVHVPKVKSPSMQMENKHNIVADIAKTDTLSKYHEEEIPVDSSEIIEVPYHVNDGSTLESNSKAVTFHKSHFTNINKLSKIESVNKAYITNVKKGNLNQDIESVKSTYLKSSQNKATIERTPQIKYEDESKVNFNDEEETKVLKEDLFPKESLPINNPIIEKPESFINKTEKDSEAATSEAHSDHFKIRNNGDKNKDSIEYESNEEETITSDGISKNTKTSTMHTLWKLIKVVTDSIYKSTRKSFKSKINYLQGLKSNILSSIEEQVERTWPDDASRSSRGVREAGRAHVEFPSSESALMSISFLTFAVFLIKLVLQVIHTYKNKTMMVTPAVVTAVGRAAAAMKSK